MKDRMRALPRNSKQWWSIAKQLLHKNSSASFAPPLKDSGGNWHRDFEQSSQDMPAQGIITGQLREPARANAMGP